MEDLYDVVIIGAGPSGLACSIYLARAKYKVLVVEKDKIGGQITITNEVVNYPGVFSTTGEDLTNNMKKQAEKFGAQFSIDEVVDLKFDNEIKEVITKNKTIKALGVVLALGAKPRKVGFKNEEKFMGRGVAYCATCDGEFFKGMDIYVVGGGFAACEEGIFLTKYATKVHMIVREEDFTCAKTIVDKVYKEDKIDVSFNTEVVSVDGDVHLNKIVLKNNVTQEETIKTHESFGVFVFAGYEPNTKWLKDIDLDKGYIITNNKGETNKEGVYACGDVCIKELRQVVTAVSDGATVATNAEKHVERLHKKLDIKPLVTNIPKNNHNEKLIDDDMTNALQQVFDRFENNVIVKGFISKDELGENIKSFLDEVDNLSEKINIETIDNNESYIEIYDHHNKSSNIKFIGIPSGHEFNSFIFALYNVAGPGKQLEDNTKESIKDLEKLDLKVAVSLSCTKCPTVVQSAFLISSINKEIKSTMIDINYNEDIKKKFNIMSVPCLIINDKEVVFGKKGLDEIIDILKKY